MVLAQKQTYTSMEQNTETINTLNHRQSMTEEAIIYNGEKILHLTCFWEIWTAICTNNEIGILSHTMNKNKFKMV